MTARIHIKQGNDKYNNTCMYNIYNGVFSLHKTCKVYWLKQIEIIYNLRHQHKYKIKCILTKLIKNNKYFKTLKH